MDIEHELRAMDPVYFASFLGSPRFLQASFLDLLRFLQGLMREVLDKLDECEGRLSELLIDSATGESEANSPIKMTLQEKKQKK